MNGEATATSSWNKIKHKREELPPPLVKPWRHPIRWTKQRVELLGAAAVFTYVGILVIAALYYLLFETTSFMTQGWHEVVPNSALRHNIRDVGEGFLGGLLAHMIVWDHFKKSLKKKPNFIDKIEIKLHIPNPKCDKRLSGWQILFVTPLCLLYAAPGFFLSELILSHVHYTFHAYPGGDLITNVKNSFVEGWPKKVIGYAAAFAFGRRPARGVYDGIQLWFAERRVVLGKRVRFYHMPVFQARYNAVKESGHTLVHATKIQVAAMTVVCVLCFGLAGYGYYVLNYIAKPAKAVPAVVKHK